MTEAAWQPVRKVRTHEQVLAQIERKILDGELRVGERLPSERELAEALGVSRASIREALRALEVMGIIESHIGSGPESGSFVSGRSNEALGNLLRLHMALAQISLADLVDIRCQLEQNNARRAAVRRTDEDLRHLESLIDSMRAPGLRYEDFNELDTEFHVSVARASKNALASDLMQALRDAVKHKMTAAFASLPDWRAATDKLILEHDELLRLIRERDADGAASRIGDHIEGFYQHQVMGDGAGQR
ncbi:MAG TPA: FadR/GntR family transcriptional regulator [Trebonia sp.]|nr:FadR/GntR family transcriptional regulator [Trebonia sp.]